MNVTPEEAAWNEETRRIMALSDWTSGVNHAIRETAKDMARKMKADNMPVDQITKYTGLTEKQIKGL